MHYLKEMFRMVQPGLGLKRWLGAVFLGLLSMSVGTTIWLSKLFHRVTDRSLVSTVTLQFIPAFPRGLLFITGGAITTWAAWQRLSRSLMRVMLPERPETPLREVLIQRQRAERGRRVVIIGGDPGVTPVVRALQLLKQDLRIDVILPASFQGTLPQDLRDKFGLSGQQIIYPAQNDATLYASLDDGRLLEGAATINRFSGGKIVDLFLSRDIRRVKVWESEGNGKSAAASLRDYMPSVTESSLEAVSNAELIIFAPGRIYTQLLPNLTLPRLAEAVRSSAASKVYIANLMTEPGKTDEWTVADHLETIQQLTGVTMDYAIVHQGQVSETMLVQYRNEGSSVVTMKPDESTSQLIFADTGEQTTLVEGAVIISDDIVTEAPQIVSFQRGGDTILREMPVVRHDPQKLAPILERLLEEKE